MASPAFFPMTPIRSAFSLLVIQTIYALDAFVLFMLGMEGVMPGSVTPYMDPLPARFSRSCDDRTRYVFALVSSCASCLRRHDRNREPSHLSGRIGDAYSSGARHRDCNDRLDRRDAGWGVILF